VWGKVPSARPVLSRSHFIHTQTSRVHHWQIVSGYRQTAPRSRRPVLCARSLCLKRASPSQRARTTLANTACRSAVSAVNTTRPSVTSPSAERGSIDTFIQHYIRPAPHHRTSFVQRDRGYQPVRSAVTVSVSSAACQWSVSESTASL